MKPKLPKPKNDAAAEAIIATTDLAQHDLSGFKPMRFEFATKEARINMRVPENLLIAVKEAAAEAGIPYQRYIRQTLEESLR